MLSDPRYSIADVRALLSQRVGLDLSPIELAEILWLALQRGVVVPEDLEERQPPPFTQEPELEPGPEPPERSSSTGSSSSKESIPIVAEPPELRSTETEEESDQIAGPALPINIPETVALRNRQAIARSLRPLMRKVASKQRRVLDEEATVIQVAETQTWSPVVKPEPERWLELAIVIEVTNLLDVWQDTIAEFQQLMERHGAFRNVRTWQLKPNAEGEPQLFLQTSRGLRSSPRSPWELLDASGRRQILLLSDCTSRAWRTGKIPKLLELWSRENPVAIVQLLPEHYWDRSALKASYPVALKSNRPGALSRDWLIENLSPRRKQQLPQGLKLPVVTIQPESLGQWAKAIAASSDQSTTGIIFNPQGFQAPASTTQAPPLTAKQLVQRFRNTASEQAQELADMMAVLPVNWSVIRLIQKNLVQEEPWQQTGALYLAEIFLSGLLRPISAESEPAPKHQKTPQYDFVEGVRDVLLGTIPISEAQSVGEEVAEAVFKQLPNEVQERVNADIERRYGDALSYFEAFLIPDLPWGENAVAEVFPFAQVTGQVLRRWGGDYAALAEELERQEASNQQRGERYLDEATVYAALEQQLDYIQRRIGDTFSQQDHEFELHFPGLRPKEIAAEPSPEEIMLAESEETSVTILEHTITAISKGQVVLELGVRIRFAANLIYFDSEAYHREFNEHPTYEETAHNQTVDAAAEVILVFSEDRNEVGTELGELRVEQPILINPLQQDKEIPAQTPPLQWFEFEVAEIAFSPFLTPISLQPIPLQSFLFTVATLTGTRPPNMSVEDKLEALEAALLSQSKQNLDGIQKALIRGSLQNRTYQQIAEHISVTEVHLRRGIGTKLWKLLTLLLEELVTKKTFPSVINKWLWRQCIQREQHERQQFTEYLDNGFKLEMVLIPAGNLLMGSPEDEEGRNSRERPQHPVNIRSFFMGKFPVTQLQWRAVAALPQVNRKLEPDPSRFKGDVGEASRNENRPVERITWYDAVEFCDRLSQHTGKHYRLPSEAEWEYACRAGSTTPFHFGETITSDLANYNGNYTYGNGPKGIYREETTPVGSFGVANAFGLYDMHGNVMEWCADHWHGNYEGAPKDGSAWITDGDSDRRVLRGGSWYSDPQDCRSAYRSREVADDWYVYFGFRVVCSG